MSLPDWLEKQQQHLAREIEEQARQAPWLSATNLVKENTASIRDFFLDAPAALDECSAIENSRRVAIAWQFACNLLRVSLAHAEEVRAVIRRSPLTSFFSSMTRAYLDEMNSRVAEVADLVRSVAIGRPELNLEVPADLNKAVWTVRIAPLAYLRAMANLFWSAIRHPLSETTIDLSTGRVLYRT